MPHFAFGTTDTIRTDKFDWNIYIWISRTIIWSNYYFLQARVGVSAPLHRHWHISQSTFWCARASVRVCYASNESELPTKWSVNILIWLPLVRTSTVDDGSFGWPKVESIIILYKTKQCVRQCQLADGGIDKIPFNYVSMHINGWNIDNSFDLHMFFFFRSHRHCLLCACSAYVSAGSTNLSHSHFNLVRKVKYVHTVDATSTAKRRCLPMQMTRSRSQSGRLSTVANDAQHIQLMYQFTTNTN